MDSETLADLKEFIARTVSMEIASVRDDLKSVEQRLDGKIDGVEKRLDSKMDDGFGGVGEAIQRLTDIADNHENRLTKLEESPV